MVYGSLRTIHWRIQDFTKGGLGTGKQFMIVCITKDWIKYSGIDL